MFFCVKIIISTIIRLVNSISQEKFTILNVSHIGFLCYLDSDEIIIIIIIIIIIMMMMMIWR